MNRKTKMAYNAEAKWLVWQKLILCDYYAHTVVQSASILGTIAAMEEHLDYGRKEV